jgi:PIN domain
VPAPVAVLDACVLFQGRLTNLLLHLAEAKAFAPLWSDDIHVEWMRNLHSRVGIPIDKIEYRRGEMERAFPAANVAAPPTLVATIRGVSKTAAQRKDAHVVATAVIAEAAVIVTHNIRDFSPEVLGRYGLARVRPGAFCVGLLAGHETQVLAGIRMHRANLRRTPMSPAQYIDHLAEDRLGMPRWSWTARFL